MTEDEAREIAKTAAREVAHEILTALGIDMDEPFEMQRDFQHLRRWRISTEAVKRQGLLALTGIFVSGLVAAIWLAITSGRSP